MCTQYLKNNVVMNVDEIRHVDQYAMEQLQIPGIVLMDKAGHAASEKILQIFKLRKKDTVAIFAGPGNNGGDGFVVARYLYNFGCDVQIITCKNPAEYKGDQLIAWKSIEKLPGIKKHSWENFRKDNFTPVVIVDALLGTGFSGKLTQKLVEIISYINSIHAKKCSLDIPSGLHGDKLKIPDTFFQTEHTISFGFPKTSQTIELTKQHMGHLHTVDIGYPPDVLKSFKPNKFLIDPSVIIQKMNHRNASNHKGSQGKVLVIGGSEGMHGAPIIAAHSALKSGAGLVFVLTPSIKAGFKIEYPPEIMVSTLNSNETYFTKSNVKEILDFINEKSIDSVILGMGIGRQYATLEFVEKFMEKISIPVVLDADALLIYNSTLNHPHNCIVTPHAKEFKDNFSDQFLTEERNPIEKLKSIANKKQVVIAHKSSTTLIATPENEVYINQTGNPYMASAGMGDCLAGIIGSLLAQGYTKCEASIYGVALHGLSGDLARNQSFINVLATELSDKIKNALD